MTGLKTHEPLWMTVNRESISIGLQCLFETNFAFDGSRDTLPDNDGRQLRARRRGHKRKLAYRHDGRMNAWTDIDDSSKRVALLKAMHTILRNRAYMWTVLHCIPCS